MNQLTQKQSPVDLAPILAKHPLLLFDGECGFCNQSILFFLRREKPGSTKVHFISLQSDLGKSVRDYFEIDKELDSIILIKDHNAYIKSCAALRQCHR